MKRTGEKQAPGVADEELAGSPMGNALQGADSPGTGVPGLWGGDAAFLARVNAMRKEVGARMKTAFGAQTSEDFKAATGYYAVSEALLAIDDEELIARIEAYIHAHPSPSEAALTQVAREAISKRLSELFGKGDQAAFKAATGYDFFATAIEQGMSRQAIAQAVETYIEAHKDGPPVGQGHGQPEPPPGSQRPAPPAQNQGQARGQPQGQLRRGVVDLKGKKYLLAEARVRKFREAHPAGCIRTEMLGYDDDSAMFKAEVLSADGQLLAVAHARATLASSGKADGRYLEKAETAAISRALALAGFGSPED